MNTTPELTERDFQIFRDLLYRHAGIHLHEGKRQLVKTRLSKRLRQGGFSSFRHYYKHLVADRTGEELSRFIDAITTNLTGFFREPAHFDFLEEELYPRIRQELENGTRSARIVFWSAGCSTGEEPYSLAIHAVEHWGDTPDIRLIVHATDISQGAIRKAVRGIYPLSRVRSLPRRLLRRHFLKGTGPQDGFVKVKPHLRAMVKFQCGNLLECSPPEDEIDAIFCRNVMIYFDRGSQHRALRNLVHALRPGGYLIVGHAESLSANKLQAGLEYVRPSIYRKR